MREKRNAPITNMNTCEASPTTENKHEKVKTEMLKASLYAMTP